MMGQEGLRGQHGDLGSGRTDQWGGGVVLEGREAQAFPPEKGCLLAPTKSQATSS